MDWKTHWCTFVYYAWRPVWRPLSQGRRGLLRSSRPGRAAQRATRRATERRAWRNLAQRGRGDEFWRCVVLIPSPVDLAGSRRLFLPPSWGKGESTGRRRCRLFTPPLTSQGGRWPCNARQDTRWSSPSYLHETQHRLRNTQVLSFISLRAFGMQIFECVR